MSLQLKCNCTHALQEKYHTVGNWEAYFSLTVRALFSLPNDAERCIKKPLDVYLTVV